MARLATFGAELRDLRTTTTETNPDGIGAGTTTPTVDTTFFRGGFASHKCAGTSANTSYMYQALTGASGVTQFAKKWYYLDVLPSAATTTLLRFGTVSLFSARITSGGKIRLYNDATALQLGSDSADTVSAGMWFCLMLSAVVATGTNVRAILMYADQNKLQPAGDGLAVQVADSGLLSITNTQPVQIQFGLITAPGNTCNCWLDDGAVNDSSGTDQSSWPDWREQVIVLRSFRTGAAGNWVPCAAATEANNVLATSTLPVAGHSDTTGDSVSHQMRNPNSGAQPYNLDMYMQTFAGGGMEGSVLREDTGGTASQFGIDGSASNNGILGQKFRMEGILEAIEVTLLNGGNATDSVTCSLYDDNGSGRPGTLLETSPDTYTTTATPTKRRFNFSPRRLGRGNLYHLILDRTGPYDLDPFTNLDYHKVSAGVSAAYYGEGIFEVKNTVSNAWFDKTPAIAFNIISSTPVGQVTVVRPIACCGPGSAQARNGSIEVTREPVVSALAFSTLATAVGAYPTGWRWQRGNVVYAPSVPNSGITPLVRVAKTENTTSVLLCCFLGLMVGWIPGSSGGWAQYSLNADSTLYWMKKCASLTLVQYGDPEAGTEVSLEVLPGYWIRIPDPLPAVGNNPTVAVAVSDSDLRSLYTAL